MKTNRVVFMLSYGRANRLKTYKYFKKMNFDGDFYCVVSDDDVQLEKYKEIFRDKLLIFKRDEVDVDYMVNWKIKTSTNARNYIQNIAREWNLSKYIMVDDDYYGIYLGWGKDKKYSGQKKSIKDLNYLIDLIFQFLEETELECVTLSQPGDYVGGRYCKIKMEGWFKRKIYNFYFFNRNNINFKGLLNEDAVVSVYYAIRGKLLLMLPFFIFKQDATQKAEGGLTDSYKNQGTYVKSFLPILICPRAVVVRPVGIKYYRWHHKINWKKISPKILRVDIN